MAMHNLQNLAIKILRIKTACHKTNEQNIKIIQSDGCLMHIIEMTHLATIVLNNQVYR